MVMEGWPPCFSFRKLKLLFGSGHGFDSISGTSNTSGPSAAALPLSKRNTSTRGGDTLMLWPSPIRLSLILLKGRDEIPIGILRVHVHAYKGHGNRPEAGCRPWQCSGTIHVNIR